MWIIMIQFLGVFFFCFFRVLFLVYYFVFFCEKDYSVGFYFVQNQNGGYVDLDLNCLFKSM